MLKRSGLMVGALALAVGIPTAALALTYDGDDSVGGAAPVVEQAQDSTPNQTNEVTAPVATQQRLRIHAETGPPDGFEPMQRRLHQSTDAGQARQRVTGTTDMTAPATTRQRLQIHAETGPPDGFEPMQRRLHQSTSVGQGMAGTGRSGGNPDAPCTGTGECVNPDGPAGSGPRSPRAGSN